MIPSIKPASPWRVATVRAMPGWMLYVRFNDGSDGTVNMAPLIQLKSAGVFAALSDAVEFSRAAVVYGAVTWPCGVDLAPDAMHAGIKAGNGSWTP
jgi:hypothetical protein